MTDSKETALESAALQLATETIKLKADYDLLLKEKGKLLGSAVMMTAQNAQLLKTLEEAATLLSVIDQMTFEEFDIGDWRTRLRALLARLSTQEQEEQS